MIEIIVPLSVTVLGVILTFSKLTKLKAASYFLLMCIVATEAFWNSNYFFLVVVVVLSLLIELSSVGYVKQKFNTSIASEKYLKIIKTLSLIVFGHLVYSLYYNNVTDIVFLPVGFENTLIKDLLIMILALGMVSFAQVEIWKK